MTPQERPSRRAVLAAGAVAGLAAPLSAIEPIVRKGPERMRLSLAAYSFRKQLAAKAGSPDAMDMAGFVDFAAEQNLDAVELTSYWFPNPITDAWAAQIKRRCHLAGLDISGGAIRNNFSTPPDDPRTAKQIAAVVEWAKVYAKLGAPVIRVFGGKPPKGITEADATKHIAANLKTAADKAGAFGVILAIENHDYLMDVERLIPIIKAVDSPWFGVNLDTANFAAGDPYENIAALAPYAVNVQVKVKTRRGKAHEDADYGRMIGLLRKANYRGYVVLEYEEAADPFKAVPQHLAALRKAINA